MAHKKLPHKTVRAHSTREGEGDVLNLYSTTAFPVRDEKYQLKSNKRTSGKTINDQSNTDSAHCQITLSS